MQHIICTMRSRNSCENYCRIKYNKLVFVIKKKIFIYVSFIILLKLLISISRVIKKNELKKNYNFFLITLTIDKIFYQMIIIHIKRNSFENSFFSLSFTIGEL